MQLFCAVMLLGAHQWASLSTAETLHIGPVHIAKLYMNFAAIEQYRYFAKVKPLFSKALILYVHPVVH